MKVKKTPKPKDYRTVPRNSRGHRSLALKAARQAANVLPLFEKTHPIDRRPRLAIEAIADWARGRRELGMAIVRKLSLDAHAAARGAKTDAARFAARAAGQAVAAWHVPNHALAVPYYVNKVAEAIKPMPKYLALLRGINVGGNNIIRMSDLKVCFEDMGFSEVTTYIQSGNVVFGAKPGNVARLTTKIEKTLATRFKYPARVVVVTQAELREAVRCAPKGFGTAPAKYRYDVIFLKKPFTAKAAIKDVSVREGVDTAAAGKHVLYFSRLMARATQSHLSKIMQKPAYAYMTIRNWNTTTKLLALMDGGK